MKVELLNMIDTISSGVVKVKPLIADYVKNKKFPLEDRWEIYSTTPANFFDSAPWYADFTFGGDEIVWSSAPHYIESRHETVDNVDVIRRYEEEIGYDENITQEKIDELKEQMLQSGYRTWENDW